MSLETVTQTEVKDPEHRKIAEAVLAVAGGGREQGHDQETIRVMLHTFGQAVSAGAHANSIGNPAECIRRY
jgi:hypothetical protein